MVTTTGITIPAWLWVRALNCLQNSMMFTPCGPSAVPTGGAGFAAPAGHCSLLTAVTFLPVPPLPVARVQQPVGSRETARWRGRGLRDVWMFGCLDLRDVF